jgi:hypothetical protein
MSYDIIDSDSVYDIIAHIIAWVDIIYDIIDKNETMIS